MCLCQRYDLALDPLSGLDVKIPWDTRPEWVSKLVFYAQSTITVISWLAWVTPLWVIQTITLTIIDAKERISPREATERVSDSSTGNREGHTNEPNFVHVFFRYSFVVSLWILTTAIIL